MIVIAIANSCFFGISYLLSVVMMTKMRMMNPTSATPAQIRRAAGGKDLFLLKQTIGTGWTVDELNNLASEDGKSAVHMAAWQGQIENLEYLLHLGCDINSIATGEFSYGKTPLFFAATRSRKNVMEYLIKQGAHVKIINNKGQSVLSIASSHMDDDMISKIQAAELEQSQISWKNYREQHSDYLEYGDLDPRFLDRPLRPTDVVTELAINPTTKASRRGSFLRKNPHVTREQLQIRKPQRKQNKMIQSKPSQDDLVQQEGAWERINHAQQEGDVNGNVERATQDLLLILRLSEKQRSPWIPKAADKLQKYTISAEIRHKIVTIAIENNETTKREVNLLEKLLQRTGDPCFKNGETAPPKTKRGYQVKEPIHLSSNLWSKARDAVYLLCSDQFKNDHCSDKMLSLSKPPEWIDSEWQLDKLLAQLTQHENTVIAVDTEWYTTFDNRTEVATIQIATVRNNKQIDTWVIDLLAEECKEAMAAIVGHIFDKCIVLVFAFRNDIDKLSSFTGRFISPNNCLDLQELAMQHMSDRLTLPGLQLCSAHFISSDYILSKDEQCSDWSLRPLRQTQLDYAGLDAAVLLLLLAEMERKYSTDIFN